MTRKYNLDEEFSVGDPLHVETHESVSKAVNDIDDRTSTIETLLTEGRLSKSELSAASVQAAEGAVFTQRGQDLITRARGQALAPWFARVSKRAVDTLPMCIWVMSHSIGEGSGASARSRRWLDRLVADAPTAFPVANVTEAALYYPAHYYSSAVASAWTYDYYTGSTPVPPVYVDNIYGWGGRSVKLASRGRMTIDPALLVGKTHARVFYPGGTSKAAITAYVNGASASTRTVETAEGEYFFDVALGGTATSFDLRHVNVSNDMHVNGVILYNDNYTKGVTVIDASHAGWSTRDYLLNQVTNRTTLAQLANKKGQFVPALCIIGLLANDYGQNVPPSEAKANLQGLIASVRSSPAVAVAPPSFLILIDTETDPAGTQSYAWSEYVRVAYEVAAEDTGGPGGSSSVAALDLGVTFPSPTVAQTLSIMSSDLVHPLDGGHQMIEDRILSAIRPR